MHMLSRARKRSKPAWIAIGSLGTLLHVAAPWLVARRVGAGVGIRAVSGLLLLLSYAWMSVIPLWEMWRR